MLQIETSLSSFPLTNLILPPLPCTIKNSNASLWKTEELNAEIGTGSMVMKNCITFLWQIRLYIKASRNLYFSISVSVKPILPCKKCVTVTETNELQKPTKMQTSNTTFLHMSKFCRNAHVYMCDIRQYMNSSASYKH